MSVPWYLMAKGKGGGTKTASGPIAHWTDGVDAPLKSLLVNIDPVQAGSGDPSTDNVRPISGWSECKVWVKPTYDPTANPTATIQLGQTVYGGTLDVLNGVLTVDRAMYTFDGSNDEAWNDYSNYNGYYIQLNAMKSGNRQDGWSNMLKDSKTSAQGQIGAMWLGVNNSKNFFVIGVHDTMGATLSVFRSYLSEHPLELVYPLATPLTIPLTPTEISTLQGQNNVWGDCGDVTVEYLSAGGANPDLMKLAVAFMGR